MYRALTAHTPLGAEALGDVAVVEPETQDGIRRCFSGRIVEARMRTR
jgi:hypothetical protein